MWCRTGSWVDVTFGGGQSKLLAVVWLCVRPTYQCILVLAMVVRRLECHGRGVLRPVAAQTLRMMQVVHQVVVMVVVALVLAQGCRAVEPAQGRQAQDSC